MTEHDAPAGAVTRGVHHVGLTVSRLEESAAFFTGLLGWREVRRDAEYPAVFVSDGSVLVTLWQVNDPEHAPAFDWKNRVGLHHLALEVDSRERLEALYGILAEAPGVRIEFAPEPLRGGPAMHMMCYEPSGIRVELIHPATPAA